MGLGKLVSKLAPFALLGGIGLGSAGCVTPRYSWIDVARDSKVVGTTSQERIEGKLNSKIDITKSKELQVSLHKEEFKIVDYFDILVPVVQQEEKLQNYADIKKVHEANVYWVLPVVGGGTLLAAYYGSKQSIDSVWQGALAGAVTSGITLMFLNKAPPRVRSKQELVLGDQRYNAKTRTDESKTGRISPASGIGVSLNSEYFKLDPKSKITDSDGTAFFKITFPWFDLVDRVDFDSVKNMNFTKDELKFLKEELKKRSKNNEIEVNAGGNVINTTISGIVDKEMLSSSAGLVLAARKEKAQKSQKKVDELYSLASRSVQSQSYSEALQSLDELQILSPSYKGSPELRSTAVAGIYALKKENDLQRMLFKADENYSAGKFSDALKSYETAVSMKPLDQRAAYGRIRSIISLGRTEEAIAVLDSMLSKKASAEVFYLRALAYDRLGKIKEAAKDFKQAKSMDANIADKFK